MLEEMFHPLVLLHGYTVCIVSLSVGTGFFLFSMILFRESENNRITPAIQPYAVVVFVWVCWHW